MRILHVILLLSCLPLSAWAGQSSIVYTKATLRIVPQPGTVNSHPQPTAKPDGAAQKPADAKKDAASPAPAARETKTLTVEVRGLNVLEQKDFIVHEPFSGNKGLLILIDPPQQVALKAAPLLGKTDVLLITPDGIVAKIAPRLALAELGEPIALDGPLRAFLFLKPGEAEESDIQPGDRAESALFKTHPVVLDAPNRTIIIGNSPVPGSAQAEENAQARREKKPMPKPQATAPSSNLYPVDSAPTDENRQLMQELQK